MEQMPRKATNPGMPIIYQKRFGPTLTSFRDEPRHQQQFDTLDNAVIQHSLKWNTFSPDVLPMAIAEMDFLSPDPIIAAIQKRSKRGYLGYQKAPESWFNAIQRYLFAKHSILAERDQILPLNGLVCALSIIGRLALQKSQSIIVPTPCYPPFTRAPQLMGARVQTVEMPQRFDGRRELDLERLTDCVKSGGKILLLCNPHNPTGKVFTVDELVALSSWAIVNEVTIVSDEIHCDLILDKHRRHISLASLSPEIASQTITLMSPSKTYNMAGLKGAFAVINNEKLRGEFKVASQDIIPGPSLEALYAMQAAYTQCESWRESLLEYLRGNRALVTETLKPHLMDIKYVQPEATYLAWIDLSATRHADPYKSILEQGKLALGNGAEFLAPGHVRLNFGTPRLVLQEGLRRLTDLL